MTPTKYTDSEKDPLQTMTVLQHNDRITSLKELYCVNCLNFLWPPIMLGKTGNICGNCWKTDSDEFIPNTVLETILQKLSIRCRNFENGCQVRNDYNEMALHDEQCIYRKFDCPINSLDSCDWLGYSNKLVDHFSQDHPLNVITTKTNSVSIDVDVEDDVKLVKLLLLPNGNFLTSLSTDTTNEKLSIAVFFVDDSKSVADDYQFHVQLNSSGNTYICQVQDESNIINIGNYNEDHVNALKVDTTQMKSISTDGLYKCTLKITTNASEQKVNEQLLQHFECPVCKNYMRAPIYQCPTGHSVCNQCKPELRNCPMCQFAIGTIRNFSLEAFCNLNYFPCSYFDDGCVQICLGVDINKHEDECIFRPYICPFKEENCQWTDLLTNMSAHFKTSHLDLSYIKNEEKLKLPCTYAYKDTYCLMTYGEIFMIYYYAKKDGSNLHWDVQLVGPESKCKAYSFEITLINDKNPHKRLIRIDICKKYAIKSDYSTAPVMIPSNLITSFSNNEKLTFYVKVVKTGV